MIGSLWKMALGRPIMSSLVGITVGTASSLSVAAVQPQPVNHAFVAPGYRVAQAEPPSGGGGGEFRGAPPQGGGGGGFGGERQEFRNAPPQGSGGGEGGFGGPAGREVRRGEPQKSGAPQDFREPMNEEKKFEQRGNVEERRMDNFNGEGDEGNRGPSQEEMDKRQAEMEARQAAEEERYETERKKQEERSLQMMKKGMAQAGRGVDQMKKYFDKIAKKGVVIPSECSEVLAKIQTTVSAIKNATTFDEAQEADPESMRDDFEMLNDCRQKMEMLAQIPSILKRVDKEIKNMERNWNRAKKNAPVDTAEAIIEGDSILASLKSARAKIVELTKTGDVDMDEIQGVLEDEIYGRFDDLGGAMQRLEAARNSKRFFAESTRRIKEAERMIARLKKRGEDTSQLEELLVQAKELQAQIKNMKVGSEEFMDAVDELAELGQDFAQAAPGDVDMEKMFKGPGGGPPQVQLPKF